MVCVYCNAKTKVVNSRWKKQSNKVWRRRECLNCHAVFTTEETVDLSNIWLVTDKLTGTDSKFLVEKLLISLHECLRHRPNSASDALNITDTIVARLKRSTVTNSRIDKTVIKETAFVALNRFDTTAGMLYRAIHDT